MELHELTKIVDSMELTESDIAELKVRLTEYDEKYEAEARKRAVTEEWLNRRYTI